MSRPASQFRMAFVCAALAAVCLVLASKAVAADVRDSQGRDFWLAFPGNVSEEQTRLFISGERATRGTVSIPGLEFTDSFSVAPGEVTTVDVPAAAQVQTSNVVEDKGIHVSAGEEVTVYGLNRASATTDAYLGLPTDALGTEYIALGYPNVDVVNGNQFTLVGTEDATTVTITPRASTPERPAGTPYAVTLDRGQTYQLRDENPAPSDLSGSLIKADKPVAAFGGHRCANIPRGHTYCDHVVEQLPPTGAWGKEFFSMPLATRAQGDTFRVVAAADDTTVELNGSAVATLDRGEVHEQTVSGPSHWLADGPVLVMQYSNSESYDGDADSDGDPFQMMIPPHEQYLAAYTVSTPASGFDPNFLNVVAPTSAIGSVKVDGRAIASEEFSPIGDSPFSGARVPISLGTHRVTSPEPIGVHAYGFGFNDSYGYAGGLLLSEPARVENVSLSPDDATSDVGSEHCVTATVRDRGGQPLEDIRVDFEVSGVTSASSFALTDGSGEAESCYTSSNEGEDTITGSVGDVSDTASNRWVSEPPPPPPAASLELEPRSGSKVVGESHTVTARASDGAPLAGAAVRYAIEGANPAAGELTTDADGRTSLTWLGLRRGTDTVTMFLDANGDGGRDPAEPQDAVSVDFEVPAISPENIQQGETAVVEPLAGGDVLVALPASEAPGLARAQGAQTPTVAPSPGRGFTRFVRLADVTRIPMGSILDSTRGGVRLNTTGPRSGVFQSGDFGGGQFRMTQSARSPLVDLTLRGGDFSRCRARSRSTRGVATTAGRRRIRRLVGRSRGGRFRTRGRRSAATVRGTRWVMEDRCDGTYTRVSEGEVVVRDFARRRNIILRPGESYLARARGARSGRPR